ncbi:Aminoglycoside phosphotransferase domain-containing protein [Madurella fahalii]|uniref:Aminoglycoside phosphotransferase domain-containing protein n=1 Tax=Madurella fahalii TaxID=1157608 RepID=A0ABQ0G3T0_9PEZI
MADRDVAPDENLLKHIFASNRPSSISIILQNWDKCMFTAVLPNALRNCRHSCVVRLEAQNGESAHFTMVAAMQEIAATCIPDLVPETLQVGSAADGQGREFQFCVMELVEGVTLEEAWDQMTDEDRRSVTTAIVEALSKLHSVRLSDAKVQAILRRALGEGSEEILDKAAMGGPLTGFLNDGSSLLSSIEQKWKLRRPFYTIQPIADPKGLVIQSHFEDVGLITVSDSDMEQWPKEAVFCHNDLTPRNLILQCSASPIGNTRYKLAAIIDWELAGFYPPSYQLSLQDTYLGGGNRCFSFYLLLKERMKDIAPPSPSQVVLLRAMELIFESQQRRLSEGTNIPAHIRKRFREALRLYRDKNPYVGRKWETKGGLLPEFSRGDAQKLEDDVVAEMIGRRQAKVKPA